MLNTVSIITSPANLLMSKIHNSKLRMPFIVAQGEWDQWFDKATDVEAVKAMMRPYQDGILQSHGISKLITSRSENSNLPNVQNPFSNDLFG
ncbi:hypothetical protein CJD36_019200 [Flavipsychrobacter stenotrophus]|uniref:Abasic site processing protein n=1 Tax=Flavipsychrobacter stenotrophus TaxID=2077091 RepID=A0A2S7SS51_9BACT|nr:hypothetical protein CJD36_019200 [Flavipsychrobacter stenotrophus]